MPYQKPLGLTAALIVTATVLTAQERPIVFQGARIIPISGPEIDNGVLIVAGGKIAAVGARGAVSIPAGAEVRDAVGKVIMPGLVDTHSHIGGGDGGDQSAALHPDVRVLDAINVRDPSLRRALAGGITTANIMPGSGLLSSGQTAYVKLRPGRTIDDLLYCRDSVTDICGGLKMANGTNPRGAAPRPGTRAKAAAMVRAKFVAASEYRQKLREAGTDSTKRPKRDLELETLVEVLDGKRVVHHHTHRADDIATVLRLREEFGFRVVLQHVSEGYRVAAEIAAAGVPASLTIVDSPGGKIEAINTDFGNARMLDEAGVMIGFNTDDGITDSRFFLRTAALAVRAGMDRAKALYGMTMAGARMLDLNDRIGSLEAGKDADFIILSGDPLSTYSQVLETWILGAKVFDLSDPRDRVFAMGGPGSQGPGGMTNHHADMEDHR